MKNIRKEKESARDRARYSLVLSLAAVACLCSIINACSHNVDKLTRRAGGSLQPYIPAGAVVPQENPVLCPLHGTSKLSTPNTVINKTSVRLKSKERLHFLKGYTVPNYEKFFVDDPGKEHYTLWHYLTESYHTAKDCRHVVDIGTRYAASALALGASGVPVKTFDIPESRERFQAFRGQSEEAWQGLLQMSAGAHIEFYNLDLLGIPDEEFRNYMSTWLIVLDTFHKPYSVPFEREFLDRLVSTEPKFEGMLLLDDIHFNREMEQWWHEIEANAEKWGYKPYDLSTIGHHSGTGLLDFSRQVSIAE